MPKTATSDLTRAKVESMVRGLFPRVEQDQVLATLERSVVFLASTNIESILLAQRWDRSAWTIANLYLAGVGAALLADDAPHLAGLSEETTCYVSPDYFAEDDPFADFIVHEVAHIFHNCKRATIGLRETRTKVWLLDIEYFEAGDLCLCVRSLRADSRAHERTLWNGGRSPRNTEVRCAFRMNALTLQKQQVSSWRLRRRVTDGNLSSRGVHPPLCRISDGDG